MSEIIKGEDTMMEYFARAKRYDDSITDTQRITLGILSRRTGISIDIDSLTYGTAAETLLYLAKQLRYL
jgi:hypothetical protein